MEGRTTDHNSNTDNEIEHDNDSTPIISPRSLQTSKMIEAMKTGKAGDLITEEQLTKICEIPWNEGHLASARRYCLRNHGIIWARVRGAQAIKCLSSSETLTVGESDLKRVHRASKRAVRKLATVKPNELKNGEHTKLNSLMAQHGTLAAFSSSQASKALETRKASEPVELKRLLEAMKD